MKRFNFIAAGVVLLNIAIAVNFYPRLPEQLTTHWTINGVANGTTSKFWGVILGPIIVAIVYGLYLLIPRIDPKKNNIQSFQKYFDTFINLLLIFLTYIYSIIIAWNLGQRFDFALLILPALAILFFYLGIMLENAKQNWFIGIRTPWTLSNEKVWDKTHALGGKTFKTAAIISLFGLLSRPLTFWFLIVPILLAAFVPAIYSYFEFQKQK